MVRLVYQEEKGNQTHLGASELRPAESADSIDNQIKENSSLPEADRREGRRESLEKEHTQELPQSATLEQGKALSIQLQNLESIVPIRLEHRRGRRSIVDHVDAKREIPWTPTSLKRSKSAIIYKNTLNDALLVRERHNLFFTRWKPYFFSLQKNHILLFTTRQEWEQGEEPSKSIALHKNQWLGDLAVDVMDDDYGHGVQMRLFRRVLFQDDALSQWLDTELGDHPSNSDPDKQKQDGKDVVDPDLSIDSESQNHTLLSLSKRCDNATIVFEFATPNQAQFELWSKSIRMVLAKVRHQEDERTKGQRKRTAGHHFGNRTEQTNLEEEVEGNQKSRRSILSFVSPAPEKQQQELNEGKKRTDWITPGHDVRITLFQAELWLDKVTSYGDIAKTESELRRLTAMEKLVNQITNDTMALLVYEKVSRIHEIFLWNSRRELEDPSLLNEAMAGDHSPESRLEDASSSASQLTFVPLPKAVLDLFADHLKRKYSVFLSLALAHKVSERDIRETHQRMCIENNAEHSGIGGGGEESGADLQEAVRTGFDSSEAKEIYSKYRLAAKTYYDINFGDADAAEEEDAIMHLPVLVQVAYMQNDHEQYETLSRILEQVLVRLETCVQEYHQQQQQQT